MIPFNEEEINEFKIEAGDLLDSAEKSLLALKHGEAFSAHYDSLFRVFHSLKGASGMMELAAIQSHMHKLESIFVDQKGKLQISQTLVDFFLRGADATRALLEGEEIAFDYDITEGSGPVAAPKSSAPSEAPPASPAPIAEAAAEAPLRKPGHRGVVLTVDDEPHLVDILHELLSDAGFEVYGTSNPEDALEMITKHRPDVVLSDISMPRISGQELLRLIRRAHPDLPVIFLSGHVDKTALLEAISNGVYSVLEKPFNHLQVVESCANAAKRHYLTKLFQRSLNLLLYQFSDLDDFLVHQGKEDVRNSIRHELTGLLEQVKEMRGSSADKKKLA